MQKMHYTYLNDLSYFFVNKNNENEQKYKKANKIEIFLNNYSRKLSKIMTIDRIFKPE